MKSASNSLAYPNEKLLLFFAAVLVFLIYSNILGGGFLLDDSGNIENNPHIRLEKLTAKSIIDAGFKSPSSKRPVANISFALNYYFHQYKVAGYRLVNILVHIITGILLYGFLKTTLIQVFPSGSKPAGWIPLLTAGIWLVHPIQTQSVSYIVQRMNSLAAMFFVFSLLCYALARLAVEKRKKWALFTGCILTGLLSLGSKETAATLPFFIFLYEWYFFQDLSWTWLKSHLFYFLIIVFLTGFFALMYTGFQPLETILSAYKLRDFTLEQRLLTELRVVVFYISLLVFPHPSRLNLDHDFPISHSLIDPVTTLFSLAVIIGLTGFAIYSAKKDRLISFGILWFLGNLVIESSVIGLEIIFEHRTYLPSMFAGLIAVTLIYRYLKPQWMGTLVLCILVAVYAFWTYERNSLWGNNVALWEDCVKKSPDKARPHHNLGVALENQGDFKGAIYHYNETLKIKPDYADAHYNLGGIYTKQQNYKEAIRHYLETLKIKSTDANAHYNLGVIFLTQRRVKRAVYHFNESIRSNPDHLEAHNNLGVILARLDRVEKAKYHFSEALRIKPNDAKAHQNLGLALARQGRPQEAIDHYTKALEINPDYAKAHHSLGNALLKLGRIDEAVNHYKEALRLKPDYDRAESSLKKALKKIQQQPNPSRLD